MADDPALTPPALHRVAKLLARAGVASRRDVERMIEGGRVALNGAVLDTPATLLATLDGITVDGEPVAEAEPTRLFLFHKPAGYLTAARDPMGRPTIYDRLPADLPRLVPVGRLDLNTEGLLLLTTDGAFKRQLELPATGVERAYRARAYGDVTQAQLEELIDGVEIDGIRYGGIDANLERRTGANVWVEMILTEGKNREVRRVLEHLGLQVSRLIRTRYGPFVMGDLPVGAIGEVRAADLAAFRHSLKSARASSDQTTITAAAIRPAARAVNVARPGRAPERDASLSAGYDPTQAPRQRDERVFTRGAFGSRPPADDRARGSVAATEAGRGHRRSNATRGDQERASHGAQRRTRSPQAGGTADGAHDRRATASPRAPSTGNDARPDKRPRVRSASPGAIDRATPRARSTAGDHTREAQRGSDRRANDPCPTGQRLDRGDRAPRIDPDRTRPERGRPQQPTRGGSDARANKPGTPRASSHDEAPATPRPPRPERKAGWARPKPKPDTRPGKPRK